MEGCRAERIEPLRQRHEAPDHGRAEPPAERHAEGNGEAAIGDDAGLDRTGHGRLVAGVNSVNAAGEDGAIAIQSRHLIIWLKFSIFDR